MPRETDPECAYDDLQALILKVALNIYVAYNKA